jgi:single-strand DNA-binding protein
MATFNQATIIGNLGSDPVLRYTGGGTAVCNLSIATTEFWKDADGNKSQKTEWHRVVLYGRQAEVAGQYTKKGSNVMIQGRLQTKKWTDKDHIDHYTTEIIGDRFLMLNRHEENVAASNTPTDEQLSHPSGDPEMDAWAKEYAEGEKEEEEKEEEKQKRAKGRAAKSQPKN